MLGVMLGGRVVVLVLSDFLDISTRSIYSISKKDVTILETRLPRVSIVVSETIALDECLRDKEAVGLGLPLTVSKVEIESLSKTGIKVSDGGRC